MVRRFRLLFKQEHDLPDFLGEVALRTKGRTPCRHKQLEVNGQMLHLFAL